MPCIEMPEVAFLYGYLLVYARVNTPETGLILAFFAVTDVLYRRQIMLSLPPWRKTKA
jgi:hypothetical protein